MSAIKAAVAAWVAALLALQLGASLVGGAAARQLEPSSQDDATSHQPPPGAAAVGRDEAAAHPSSAPAPPLVMPLSTNEHSAAYAGLPAVALVQQLTGRGPCTQPVTCFIPPCSLPGACPVGRVCLDDYCGGCNVVCPQRAALCHVMLRLDPTAACPA